MTNRREKSFLKGVKSEQRFASYLLAKGIDFTSEVGTDADLKGKIDFVVEGLTVNVKAPTGSGPEGLCVEWRAVDGSTGWLHKIDYVVKFIKDYTYWRIPCAELKKLVITNHGEPPTKCPQTNAGGANWNWYARKTYEGKDRSGEACIIVPFKEIKHLAKVIDL